MLYPASAVVSSQRGHHPSVSEVKSAEGKRRENPKSRFQIVACISSLGRNRHLCCYVVVIEIDFSFDFPQLLSNSKEAELGGGVQSAIDTGKGTLLCLFRIEQLPPLNPLLDLMDVYLSMRRVCQHSVHRRNNLSASSLLRLVLLCRVLLRASVTALTRLNATTVSPEGSQAPSGAQ